MANLTQTAIFSKKAVGWIIAGLIILVSLIVFLGLGKTLKNLVSPAKVAPATVAFGKLPRMDTSEGIKPPRSITYSIETISGDLLQLPEVAKVFGVAVREPTFGDLEKYKEMASRAGFDQEPTEITGSLVKFANRERNDRVLIIDRLTGNFKLESKYATDMQIISTRPQSIDSAITKASDFFRNLDINLQEFPPEKIQIRKLRIDGTNLTETQSLINANLIEVNYSRGNLDKSPVIWPRNDAAGVSALIAESTVVAATFNVSAVQKYRFASYPLKGTARAFEELKAGLGIFNEELSGNNFSIIEITLGYVESIKYSFLQPVYFFKGVDNIIAYVPAVDEAWIE